MFPLKEIKIFSWNLFKIVLKQFEYVLIENKAFSLEILFLKQLEYQILGFTASKATLNCMQNT